MVGQSASVLGAGQGDQQIDHRRHQQDLFSWIEMREVDCLGQSAIYLYVHTPQHPPFQASASSACSSQLTGTSSTHLDQQVVKLLQHQLPKGRACGGRGMQAVCVRRLSDAARATAGAAVPARDTCLA